MISLDETAMKVLEKLLIYTPVETLQKIAEKLKISVYDVIDYKAEILEKVMAKNNE